MKLALTIGDVLAACRAVQRLPGCAGGGRFGALQVIRVSHWPKIKTERTEVKRLPAHPHIVWLVERLHWLPRRWAWFEYDAPIFADAPRRVAPRRVAPHRFATQRIASRRIASHRNATSSKKGVPPYERRSPRNDDAADRQVRRGTPG